VGAWLFWLPVILVVVAAVVSFAVVRLSTLSITSSGVAFRNYPEALREIELERVDRFVPAERVGLFAFLRPATAVILLRDGTRLHVRTIRGRDGEYGVDALNQHLAEVRANQ
jgi:hypothetical protein